MNLKNKQNITIKKIKNESIDNKSIEFRYYQQEANDAIYNELLINNKCLIKMFCGTGKSLLMRKCKSMENHNLIVYVFPSLSLIDQFYNDYLYDYEKEYILKISSESESTTDPDKIMSFINKTGNKIICITYQSYKTLIENIGDIKINSCIYDESHHIVGETYQKLIFENERNTCEKQIFLTATPRNSNGIIMYDRNNLDAGMCGKLVYDYSYLRGMNEGYLNPFEIRIDMYLENTNKSIYESISRAILVSGNNRVLTFHADVNTDRITSVLNFVNENEFKKAFDKDLINEFPEKKGYYTQIKMIALDASIRLKERRNILDTFDKTESNQIFIISSCETIGEGIDTKNANMCVFADPKTSFVKIIQNIGRIVRKQFGIYKPSSTILILCWVDKEKYIGCDEDREKCDEVIRNDMNENGNFNGILNVLSALKQEDEDIYDICLHYPDTFSPQEIRSNLENQGFKVLEQVGDGDLIETIENLLDDEINYEYYEDCENDEEMITRIAEDNDVCIEIHTNSFENQIEKYNSECESGEIIRLYKDEEGNQLYCPIIKKCGKKRNEESIKELDKKNRVKIDVHTNPDVSVLWKLTGDFTKDICSCILDCDVTIVDNWFERFEGLKKFIDENEETPSEKTNKKLGVWFSTQKQNYKNISQSMKIKERYDLWTKFMIEYSYYFKSNDEIWNENFKKLKDFININKKKPSYKIGDKKEIKLGQWWRNQLVDYEEKYNNKKMDENRKKLWEIFLEEYKEYFKTNDNKWNVMFKKMVEFIEKNKRRPSKSDDKYENDICNWYHNQCKQFKIKIGAFKQNDNVKKWEEFILKYKSYFIDENEKWFGILDEVKSFIFINKRRPNKETKLCDVEKRLGQWIGSQVQKYNGKKYGMNNNFRYAWSCFIDDYKEYLKTDDELWIDKLNELEQFININKKRPIYNSVDGNEKKIAQWLSTQNQLIVNNNMIKKRYDLWIQFKEKYKEYLQNADERWNEYFNDLNKFIINNKRLPLGSAKYIDEKSLNGWMQTQKFAYSNKDKGMVDTIRYNKWSEFINKYEEYFKTDEEIWDDRYDKLILFFEINKKRPNKRSNNEDEKNLGVFIGRNIKNYKEKKERMKIQKNYDKWTELINKYGDYFLTNEELWDEKIQNLKIFINLNLKLPNGKSKNDDEKSVGLWLSSQKRDYKNKSGGMKDEFRYLKWTQFLEEYKQYFDKTFDDKSVEEPEEIPKPTKSMKLKEAVQSKESSEQKRIRNKSELSILHQRYKTLNSQNLQKEFKEIPELWYKYHSISEENEKSFPEDEIPRNRIIQELNKLQFKRSKTIVDMGCGKAQIAEYFKDDKRFNFINYDHISSSDNIISCDISNIPDDDYSVEICILCLAMWGSNCHDYIKESNRILESGGKLYIIEATKRWSEEDENNNLIKGNEGNKLKILLENNGFQITFSSIEKFCLFICVKK